jgi:hypothetical protein
MEMVGDRDLLFALSLQSTVSWPGGGVGSEAALEGQGTEQVPLFHVARSPWPLLDIRPLVAPRAMQQWPVRPLPAAKRDSGSSHCGLCVQSFPAMRVAAPDPDANGPSGELVG